MAGPVITYPGITGVKQFQGAIQPGISPGQFVLLAFVSSAANQTGTLTIGDGVRAAINFPNCFRQYDDLETGSDGKQYRTVRILDRRYRLQMGFPVAGHYNQLDERKKLIPWTVASPTQLAQMLANAMGEVLQTTFLADVGLNGIDLPGGLAQPATNLPGNPAPGPRDTIIRPGGEFYRCGTNAPTTNTNPVAYWSGQTPAAVLMANLCEQFGRIFCPDPTSSNQSTIWPMGSGNTIPAGGVFLSDASSITADPLPSQIDARSNPTRFTVRLRVRAVGQEWDGTWLPWSWLSYAPARSGQAMVCVAQGTGTIVTGILYGVTINEVHFQYASVGGDTFATVCGNLAGQINTSPDLRVAGQVTATLVGSTLKITGTTVGVEYEITTEGSSLTAPWTIVCTQAPISGPIPGQPITEVSWVGAFTAGEILSVTITIGGGAPLTVSNSAPQANLNAALEDLCNQVNLATTQVVAEWSPTKLLITGATPGTAVTVTGATTGVEVVTNTVIAGTTFTPKGFEKAGFPGSVGLSANATSRLNLDQASRLTNEHWCRTYQVIGEDPRPRPVGNVVPIPPQSIPVAGLDPIVGGVPASVDNRHRIVIQNSKPEPVNPDPSRISALDGRTGQPIALETYNGYATDKPNVAYGSVHPYCMDKNRFVWRGGTYLGNTALRSRLPFQFRIIDSQHQVIQFDQPLFRILGQGSGTAYLPAELVIECGAIVLNPESSDPVCWTVSVFPGGPGPPIARYFPDLEDEVVAQYDSYHTVTGWTYLTIEEMGTRALAYANGLAATYQNVPGTSRRYSGIQTIIPDGKTRGVSWTISGDQCETAVGVSTELYRGLLPLAARRRDENLNADATRALENLNTDFKRSDALQNAVKILNSYWPRTNQ